MADHMFQALISVVGDSWGSIQRLGTSEAKRKQWDFEKQENGNVGNGEAVWGTVR